jgi:DNA transformation protein and related proteins
MPEGLAGEARCTARCARRKRCRTRPAGGAGPYTGAVATHPQFVEHCLELLSPLGPARARRMFGGHGLYVGDLFVAIIADEVLYLKVDPATRPQFEAAGCTPFTYTGKGKPMTLPYWRVPDDAMESPEGMRPWALLALQAARRSASAARPAPGGRSRPRPAR